MKSQPARLRFPWRLQAVVAFGPRVRGVHPAALPSHSDISARTGCPHEGISSASFLEAHSWAWSLVFREGVLPARNKAHLPMSELQDGDP